MPVRLSESKARALMLTAGVVPLDPYPGSAQRWRSRCERCGETVFPRLDNVRQGHRACRFCSGRVIDSRRAATEMRASGLIPQEPYPGAAVPWRCVCATCGAEVHPRYANVKCGQGGCATCGRARTAAARRLAERDVVAVMTAADLTPLDPFPGTKAPWRCRCKRCRKEVRPRYDDVVRGTGCRFCSAADVGVRRRLRPEVAVAVMLGATLQPLTPYTRANDPWLCRCLRCGQRIETMYANVRSGWRGCRRCGRLSRIEKRRFDAEKAIQIMRDAGVEPLVPYESVMTPWPSQCLACGREVAPRLNSVQRGHRACVYCSGNRVDPKAAATTMRKARLKPLVPFPGAHAAWPCRCTRCSNVVAPTYRAIAAGGGCRVCNDTAIKPAAAAAAMRGAGLAPLVPYPGANIPWRCRCTKCGKAVRPCYSTIQRGSGGCWFCRESGFKVGSPAVVYLVVHDTLNAAKVGIANKTAARHRIGQHEANGWRLLESVEMSGSRALAIEDDVLTWWRVDLGLPVFVAQAKMPQGGYTETVDVRGIDLAATIRRVRGT